MGKRRRWLVFLSVSASGPLYTSLLEQAGRFYRPRMAADLRYTTADVDYLESHFRDPNYDSGIEELHLRLRNPSRADFWDALGEAERWLAQFRDDTSWDGGGIQLCFAGHGREGDGRLVLVDGDVTPDEFMARLAEIAERMSAPHRLRVSAIFDSCHSGAFSARILDASFTPYSDLLVPWMVFASCMDDEFAMEESGLGHGIFTYCLSIRQPCVASLAAAAVQPDNSFGPSLAIAAGEIGCSLLSVGRQNPVAYYNGAGEAEVLGEHIRLFDDGESLTYIGFERLQEGLRRRRDLIAPSIALLHLQTAVAGGRSSDAEMRRQIQEELEFIRDPSAPPGAHWMERMNTVKQAHDAARARREAISREALHIRPDLGRAPS